MMNCEQGASSAVFIIAVGAVAFGLALDGDVEIYVVAVVAVIVEMNSERRATSRPRAKLRLTVA